MTPSAAGASAGRVEAKSNTGSRRRTRGDQIESDTRVTKQDQSEGSHRVAPRPVSRPPVDPNTTRAFGRPDGVNGSFVGLDRQRDQGEFTPTEQPPDPVLEEAFGRPNGAGDTLQRHPADIGALEAERDRGKPEEPDDPWRDPGAAAALGTPAMPQPALAPRRGERRQARGARRAVRRPGVLCRAGGAGDHRAGDRFRRRLGGPQDRRGGRGVHHVEGDAVDRWRLRAADRPVRAGRRLGGGFGRHRRSGWR